VPSTSSFVLTQPAWVRYECTTLGSNHRPVLMVGALECLGRSWCVAGSDGTTCWWLCSWAMPHYALCHSCLPARVASWCACMAWGTGAPLVVARESTSRYGATLCGPPLGQRQRMLAWTSRLSGVRQKLLVRGGDSLCKAETPRASQRLVVRGGDLS
jgi:hypothetical protein